MRWPLAARWRATRYVIRRVASGAHKVGWHPDPLPEHMYSVSVWYDVGLQAQSALRRDTSGAPRGGGTGCAHEQARPHWDCTSVDKLAVGAKSLAPFRAVEREQKSRANLRLELVSAGELVSRTLWCFLTERTLKSAVRLEDLLLKVKLGLDVHLESHDSPR